jgi:hypothetical protein
MAPTGKFATSPDSTFTKLAVSAQSFKKDTHFGHPAFQAISEIN